MKRWIMIVMCLLLCFAAACTTATVDPEPQDQNTPADNTQETEAEVTIAPADESETTPETDPETTPETDPETETEPDHSGDIELPELGGEDTPDLKPDLTFDTATLSGDPINSDIVKGYDLVIVNFWAEWCGPCVGEMPALERIHQEYPNVLILGVWVGDDLNGAKAVIADTGVTYPTLGVAGTLEKYSTMSMYIPATYFFDGDGDETGEPVIGGQEYEDWKAVVESLLP